MTPTWDAVHLEWVHPAPITCPCCRVCRLIVQGKSAGHCVHGGRYLGYLELRETRP